MHTPAFAGLEMRQLMVKISKFCSTLSEPPGTCALTLTIFSQWDSSWKSREMETCKSLVCLIICCLSNSSYDHMSALSKDNAPVWVTQEFSNEFLLKELWLSKLIKGPTCMQALTAE